MSVKQKIFIPFTIDTRFWNKNMPNVILNKVYEAQIEPEDKDIQYTTLQTYYTYAKDEKFQGFSSRLIVALGEVLNQYHGLNEPNRFWRAMLWLWVQEYAASIKFKIEQFNNLQKAYPPEEYTYCSYVKKLDDPYHFLSRNNARYVVDDEEYHFATYSWMAEKFFAFHVEKKDVQKKRTESKKGTLSIYEILRKVVFSCINKVMSIMYIVCSSRARIGLYHASTGGLSSILKWFLQSYGAIHAISIPIEQTDDYRIDDLFRQSLPQILKNKTSASEEEQIIIDFLPYAFPPFFIEKFKKHYDAASDYLRKHNNMAVIFTLTSMLEVSAGKICEVLLQKRGGKVIGQQHGGTYQVTIDDLERTRELEWNDMFYYWGKSALTYWAGEYPHCKISFGPSYKFRQNWEERLEQKFLNNINEGYFLFVGTAVEAYPRAYAYGNVDREQEEYVARKFMFISCLSNEAQSKMLIREYPSEYGWHLPKKIQMQFPKIRISNQERFNKVLSKCTLCVSDHLATTWIEAIFFEIPTIILLVDYEISSQHYRFRQEEKEYIEMLADVGVIIHSPEEAAALVNHLAEHGVMEWWMDEKRQRIMKLVRDRWTTKVGDIDAWWYHELMTQAENAEREMNTTAHY